MNSRFTKIFAIVMLLGSACFVGSHAAANDGPGAGGGYRPSVTQMDGPGAGGGYRPSQLADGPGAGGGYSPNQLADGPGAGGGYSPC